MAARRGVAVLVVNQVTSAGDREQTGAGAASLMRSYDSGGPGARLIPALGEAWAHACTNRVLLEWAPAGHRVARLVKSASRAPGAVAYAVVLDGVRSLRPVGAARAPRPGGEGEHLAGGVPSGLVAQDAGGAGAAEPSAGGDALVGSAAGSTAPLRASEVHGGVGRGSVVAGHKRQPDGPAG